MYVAINNEVRRLIGDIGILVDNPQHRYICGGHIFMKINKQKQKFSYISFFDFIKALILIAAFLYYFLKGYETRERKFCGTQIFQERCIEIHSAY